MRARRVRGEAEREGRGRAPCHAVVRRPREVDVRTVEPLRDHHPVSVGYGREVDGRHTGRCSAHRPRRSVGACREDGRADAATTREHDPRASRRACDRCTVGVDTDHSGVLRPRRPARVVLDEGVEPHPPHDDVSRSVDVEVGDPESHSLARRDVARKRRPGRQVAIVRDDVEHVVDGRVRQVEVPSIGRRVVSLLADVERGHDFREPVPRGDRLPKRNLVANEAVDVRDAVGHCLKRRRD